ncbi:MAG: YebC/PmpR family DNA-binding transcriptional regulator [Clostridia bacterium]|jgi:YebC/PmpR family DNA-binding regulatory protein|nr:YebC/PmpR family DNA-binding transcriptional regulator [Clostridia bacterium]MBQ7728152.1 YebC/PmpR family DNA-binding transcriptional regulator [Clostridia bacterium]
MSGHSKFANIKHKKEKNDAAKAKVFTRLSKEIAMAVKEGGSADPNANSKLRDAIAKAKANNIPNDNIERTIKKASGSQGESFEEITYEGYGPAGVALIVETATDNRNRTAGNVRSYFSKYHGNMGTTGSVSFMFEEKGLIVINDQEDEEVDEDELMMAALDAGASDFAGEDHIYEIYTEKEDVLAIADALKNAGYKIDSADRAMIPSTTVSIDDEETAKFMNLLIERLEEDEDVMNVWHNWENPDQFEQDA